MAKLDWIRAGALDTATERFKRAVADCRDRHEERTKRNVLDPFALAAIAHVFKVSSVADVRSVSGDSAIVGCIGNALGAFHQEVLGSANDWANHDRGFDLISERRCLIAEVKNKHNTMNAGTRREVVDGLKTAVRQRPSGWRAYLVCIIPKQPSRFVTPLNDAGTVLETDGASFYAEVSGRPNAIHHVLNHLCKALDVKKDVKKMIRGLESLPPRL